jgi:hypothetical protein
VEVRGGRTLFSGRVASATGKLIGVGQANRPAENAPHEKPLPSTEPLVVLQAVIAVAYACC